MQKLSAIVFNGTYSPESMPRIATEVHNPCQDRIHLCKYSFTIFTPEVFDLCSQEHWGYQKVNKGLLSKMTIVCLPTDAQFSTALTMCCCKGAWNVLEAGYSVHERRLSDVSTPVCPQCAPEDMPENPLQCGRSMTDKSIWKVFQWNF